VRAVSAAQVRCEPWHQASRHHDAPLNEGILRPSLPFWTHRRSQPYPVWPVHSVVPPAPLPAPAATVRQARGGGGGFFARSRSRVTGEQERAQQEREQAQAAALASQIALWPGPSAGQGRADGGPGMYHTGYQPSHQEYLMDAGMHDTPDEVVCQNA
jgi:hypothetical protein